MHDRGLLVALAAYAALAALPFNIVEGQTLSTGGNPVDQLPVPPLVDGQANRVDIRIIEPTAPPQTALSRAVTPLKFEIAGVQSIPFSEVSKLFEPLAGQPTTVATLAGIASQVTAIYQRQGYALSFCFVPEQDFENGVVRITAVEGYVATIKIEGDAGASEPKVMEIAERIRQDRPLLLANFERYAQLLSFLPGMRVQASAIPPANTDGAGSLVLKLVRQPYQGSISTDYRGSKLRSVVTGILNDPILPGSQLSATTLVGGFQNERFVAAAYSQVVGSEGLTLKADAFHYQGNPDAQQTVQPVIQRYVTQKRAELSASFPLKLSFQKSLLLAGGIYGVDNIDAYNNPTTGARLTDEVNARAVYAQASYTTAEPNQVQSLKIRLTKGLNSLGANSSMRSNVAGALPSNPAQLAFARLGVEGSQRNIWGKRWGTVVSFATQYSPNILPNSERISFGNTRFGRAYLAGEVAGNSGWGLGLEVNYSFASEAAYLKQIQPYALLEHARVSGNPGTVASADLKSSSLGLRLSNAAYYSVDMAVSKPLGYASPYNPERKVRMSLLVNYNLAGH